MRVESTCIRGNERVVIFAQFRVGAIRSGNEPNQISHALNRIPNQVDISYPLQRKQ